jgi:predicted short-subunit dehydrogenase-like oxidoreductase (DUF2520 family)
MTPKRTFTVIGPGKLGSALASLLQRAGHDCLGMIGREPQPDLSARADIVFITTPDGAIADVCRATVQCGGIRRGALVMHCSGALPASILEAARGVDAQLGSLHPLQTVATAQMGVRNLPGSYCCIEGDADAVPTLRTLAEALGMTPLAIATEAKPLYHAAATAASNYLVTLQDMAVALMQAAGVPGDEALPALLPLIRGTLANLDAVGLPDALTGPIARGDAATVHRQLDAVAAAAPERAEAWRTLARATLSIAVAKGTLTPDQAETLRRTLGEH